MPSTDTKRKPRKPKKNQSLELLRAVTKSMAGALPGVSDETRDIVDDSLARTVSGVASQVMGEEPETGELVFPPWHNIKRSWNADERRKRGMPRQRRAMPGLVADTLSIPELGGMVGMPVPEFASEASEQAGRMHSGADESMGLDAPVGFRQNAFSSLGTMLGQAPVPGKAKVDAARQLGGGALQMAKHYGAKALKSPIEFFSPTVDPKISNYLAGAGFGGAMGAAADNPEPIMNILRALSQQPIPQDPRIPRAPYGQPPEEELPDLNYEDLPEVSQLGKGGKVGALKQMLRAININPDSTRKTKVPYQIGEPVEEILYAVNEGTRQGVLSSDEAKQIKAMLDTGDDESLANALLDLHQRLQPKASPTAPLQALPKLVTPDPPNPYGPEKSMTLEEWDAMLARKGTPKKGKGGKITTIKGFLGKKKLRDKQFLKKLSPEDQLAELFRRATENPNPKVTAEMEARDRRAAPKGFPEAPTSHKIPTKLLFKHAKEALPDEYLEGPEDVAGMLGATTDSMRELLASHGLKVSPNGQMVEYDPSKKNDLTGIATRVMHEYDNGLTDAPDSLWYQHGLSGDDDVDYNGSYVLNLLDLLNSYLNRGK